MKNTIKHFFSAILSVCFLSACGGGAFSADAATSGPGPESDAGAAGSAPDLQGGSPDQGSTAGLDGSSGSPATMSGAGGLGGSGSTGGSGGLPAAGSPSGGSSGSVDSIAGKGGSSGDQSGGSGQGGSVSFAGQGGSSAGSSGSAGSTDLDDAKYRCQSPDSPSTPDAVKAFTSCMTTVCQNLGYVCGSIGHQCSGSNTPCGMSLDPSNYDCSFFSTSSVNACPVYSGLCTADHKCGNSCMRNSVTSAEVQADPRKTSCLELSPASMPGNLVSPVPQNANESFRYLCSVDSNTTSYLASQGCTHDTGAGAGAGSWCCPQTHSQCAVRNYPSSCPAGKPFQYTCKPGVMVGLSGDSRCANQGGSLYCCSDPDIE